MVMKQQLIVCLLVFLAIHSGWMMYILFTLPKENEATQTGDPPKLLKQSQANEPHLLFHFIHSKGPFHRRNIRVIESVFYHHPKAIVIVHVPKDGNIGLVSDLTSDPFIPLQNAGYNVTVQGFQLEPLINAVLSQEGSTVKEIRAKRWMRTKIIRHFMDLMWYIDISDLARYLVVYHYGGVFMDTDLVMVKPVDVLENVIGLERENSPNNAFLAFRKGNAFIADCINEYFLHYRPATEIWGYNGPRLVGRVFDNANYHPNCSIPSPDWERIHRMQKGNNDPFSCPVRVLWKDAFYPDIGSVNCFVVNEHVSDGVVLSSHSCTWPLYLLVAFPFDSSSNLLVTMFFYLDGKYQTEHSSK
jgi:hypothetical protein